MPWARKAAWPPSTALRGFCLRGLERADEAGADAFALLLRIDRPGQIGDELAGGVDGDQLHPHVALEGLHYLGRLALTEQAVIDEDARQPVPDGTVQ